MVEKGVAIVKVKVKVKIRISSWSAVMASRLPPGLMPCILRSMVIRIQRLQHISVPRPPGPEAHSRAVAFYSGLLGLEEVPKPRTFTDIDVTWFRIGDCEIHTFAAHPGDGIVHPGSHFCLVVEDLAGTRATLEAAGFETSDTAPIPNRPRFNTRDPFGNLIEFTHIEGDYLA